MKKRESGFTLLELIIVIGIIAILSVALVIVLNPSETLKKARDSQRISDLSTLKTAIGLYLTNTTIPQLSGGNWASAAGCQATLGTWASGNKLYYSYPTGSGTLSNGSTIDGSASSALTPNQVATPSSVNGLGWIPVDLTTLTGGSPISNLPIDPVDTVSSVTAPSSGDLVYRFGCSRSPIAYEIDATLESSAYTTAPNDMRLNDGGNSNSYYETGTNLGIIGHTTGGTDF